MAPAAEGAQPRHRVDLSLTGGGVLHFRPARRLLPAKTKLVAAWRAGARMGREEAAGSLAPRLSQGVPGSFRRRFSCGGAGSESSHLFARCLLASTGERENRDGWRRSQAQTPEPRGDAGGDPAGALNPVLPKPQPPPGVPAAGDSPRAGEDQEGICLTAPAPAPSSLRQHRTVCRPSGDI